MELPRLRFRLARYVALGAALSILAGAGHGHEVRPAVADVEVGPSRIQAEIRLTLEPVLAGIDLATLTDTNDSPLSGLADQYRDLPPDALEELWREKWPTLAPAITAEVEGAPVELMLSGVTVPPVGDPALPRDSTIRLVGSLPPDGTPVTFGWAPNWGALIVRRVGTGSDGYSAMLTAGARTEPMDRPRAAREVTPMIWATGLAMLATLGTMAWRRRRRQG